MVSLPRISPVAVLERIRLVVRTLEERPGLTSPELAELIGLGRRHTSLLLLRLEERGHGLHEGRRWFPGPQAVH
jgi:DNA-binding IclR family transcriptional regulator